MAQKKLRITVAGKTYDVVVDVADEAPASVRSRVAQVAPQAPTNTASAPKPKPAATGPGVVTAPLAGIIVTLNVAVGDKVEAEQTVITMEAMKMQTAIASPTGGTVQEILVKRGDAVTEGTALVRIG